MELGTSPCCKTNGTAREMAGRDGACLGSPATQGNLGREAAVSSWWWWSTPWYLQVVTRAGEELGRRVADGDASTSNGQREADPVKLNSGELLLVVGRTETGRGRLRSCSFLKKGREVREGEERKAKG